MRRGIIRNMSKAKTTKAKKAKLGPGGLPFDIGDKIFVRTVTHYQVGRVRTIGHDFFTLEEAGWVACTKRFHETLRTGKLEEFEPADDWVMIGRGAVVDVYPWKHELPKEPQ
ncbi:MAG: hypothetical protein PVSMB8_00560 [Vulcanimicrobiaceae bacterium]